MDKDFISPRELEALDLVAHGYGMKQAARQMGVTSIGSYLTHAKRRLNCPTTANLIYRLTKEGRLK
jgi:DNA-binding NarL/FixJ family response regulator